MQKFLKSHNASGEPLNNVTFLTIKDLFQAYADIPDGCTATGIHAGMFDLTKDKIKHILPLKMKNEEFGSMSKLRDSIKAILASGTDDIDYKAINEKLYREINQKKLKKN